MERECRGSEDLRAGIDQMAIFKSSEVCIPNLEVSGEWDLKV
jgi:hypothetical protein